MTAFRTRRSAGAPERGRAVWVAVLGVFLAAPVITLVISLLLGRSQPPAVASHRTVVTAPVQRLQSADAQPVTVNIDWQQGPTLLAPAWSGTVTGVDVGAGVAVTNGTRLLSLDGAEVPALRTQQPLYRPIGPGSQGADVGQLTLALAALGYAPDDAGGDRYDNRLAAAVSRFQAAYRPADPLSNSPTFQPDWVVWLPVDHLVVRAASAVVGAGAPAAGSAVLTGQDTVKAASIAPTMESNEPLGAGAQASELVVNVNTAASNLRITPDFDVATSDLARLGQSLPPGQTPASGVLQRSTPRAEVIVPASAVQVDSRGSTCVFVPGSRGFQAVHVTALPGPPGSDDVVGLDDSVQAVVSNPSDALGPSAC